MIAKDSLNGSSRTPKWIRLLVVKEMVCEPPVSRRRRTTPSVSVPHNDTTSIRTNILQTAAANAAEIVVLSDEEDSQGFYIADASGETNQSSNHQPGIYLKIL